MINSRLLKNGILIFILKVEVSCIYAHSKILKIDFCVLRAGAYIILIRSIIALILQEKCQYSLILVS